MYTFSHPFMDEVLSERRQLMKCVEIFQVGIFQVAIFQGKASWVVIFPGEIFLEPGHISSSF